RRADGEQGLRRGAQAAGRRLPGRIRGAGGRPSRRHLQLAGQEGRGQGRIHQGLARPGRSRRASQPGAGQAQRARRRYRQPAQTRRAGRGGTWSGQAMMNAYRFLRLGRVARTWLVAGSVVLLAGCSNLSAMLPSFLGSGAEKPKPAELTPNPNLLGVRQAWNARLGEVAFPLAPAVNGSTVTVAGS